MSDQKKLTPEQLSAVTYGQGPLMIIAGAGTGKTTVITERIKHLITSGLAKSEEILAVTFTEKAASEMESRLDESLPLGTLVSVHTFHGLCDQILRSSAIHIGRSQNYSLGTTLEILGLIKSHLWDAPLNYFRPLGNPDKFISAILTHLDRVRDENVSPEDYLNWVRTLPHSSSEDQLEIQKYQEISDFYFFYQNLKLKNNLLDFSDLITTTLELFEKRPNILKDYRSRWPWILVDEYQDINYVQSHLILKLAGPKPNLTVVGDDDQAIYKWRGASTGNLLKFLSAFPNCQKIVLTKNFRSTQVILDHAYKLITHNNPDRLEVKAGISKKLTSVSTHKETSSVRFFHLTNNREEAECIAQEIQNLKSHSPKLSWSDFAILVRANSHAESILPVLYYAGIPHRFLGPSRLLQRPEIKDLISYLEVLVNPQDETALFRVLHSDWFKISASSINDCLQKSRQDKRPLIDCVSDSSDPQIIALLSIINTHQKSIGKMTVREIIYDLFSQTSWSKKLIEFDTLEAQEIAENIIKLLNRLSSYEQKYQSDSSVPGILSWLETMSEIDESPQAAEIDWQEEDSVKILTVHSAKGLEFPVVFISSLVSARFPSINRQDPLPVPDTLINDILPEGNSHLQEERRLFYVAMTRAKKHLILTSADYYGDGKRAKKPSPFILEALGSIEPSTHEPLLPQYNINLKKSSEPTSYILNPTTYLDSSRIETFLDCPLHYKAKYLLGLSTPPSAASSFGNTIHKTFKDYFESIKTGQKIDIEKLFYSNWQSLGYGNKKREDLYKQRGLNMLQKAISQKLVSQPILFEYPIKFNLADDLVIGGKIDRIDQLPDGTLEIIDYKTSSPQNQLTQKEAQTDLQLSIYALAMSKTHPQKLLLTLYYLETGDRIQTTRTPSELEAATQEIRTLRSQISSSDFKCSGNLICKHHKCDFSNLCQVSGL